jgi:hypothetical protein
MAKRKPGFTLKLHVEAGRQLFKNREHLVKLLCGLSNLYGANQRLTKKCRKALWSIDSLRSMLDGTVCSEQSDHPSPTRIYYPGQKKSLYLRDTVQEMKNKK